MDFVILDGSKARSVAISVSRSVGRLEVQYTLSTGG
jgi:hypothetical protein